MFADSKIAHDAGRVVGVGAYRCRDCGEAISMEAMETLPPCSSCGGERYEKASMFTDLDETVGAATVTEHPEPSWVTKCRADLNRAGFFLALQDGDRQLVTEVDEGWIRIGRSAAADIQLDDPTVSRRHAIVVCTDGGELRIIDDRSMNGVYVNGERTDWSGLDDGDEIRIGRFHLYVIETDASGAPLPHTSHELPA